MGIKCITYDSIITYVRLEFGAKKTTLVTQLNNCFSSCNSLSTSLVFSNIAKISLFLSDPDVEGTSYPVAQ